MSDSDHEGLTWLQLIVGVLLPSIVLYSTFVAPSMEFKNNVELNVKPLVLPILAEANTGPGPTISKSGTPMAPDPRIQLILAQHQKCGEEIKMRLEQEEIWFHYKFAFLGVLLAGYIVRTAFREKSGDAHAEFLPPDVLRHVFRHVSTLLLLGICCAVCIVLDMHIRANRIVINENGSWIAKFAEPLLGLDGSAVIGWEKFLRLQGSHHTDSWFHLLFWPEMFLITVGVYAFYSYIFFLQIGRMQMMKSAPEPLEIKLRKGSYWLLHAMILICAVSTHYAPPNFVLTPWWSGGPAFSPNQTALGYLGFALLGLLLSLGAWWWTIHCQKRSQGNPEQGI